VVIGPARGDQRGGARYDDEFARHKALDLLGDLALLGCRVLGHIEATKSDHSQHLALLRAIVSHPECLETTGIPEAMAPSTMNAGAFILPLLSPSTAFV